MPKWTIEQQLAIDKENTNIIVSAGAGSGKTAVLTERVIRKLRDGVDINHLLVLTFTNAAASEMKNRIRRAIKKEGMTEQLDYIDSAYITTFDSYAQSIVKKYHYLLNISRNFTIIDDSSLSIIKNEIIDNIFEEKYGDERFDKFVDSYCVKDDKELRKNILKINEKINLIPNKSKYLNTYIDNYFNNRYVDSLLKEYLDLIYQKIDDIKDALDDIKVYDEKDYYKKIDEIINPLLNSNTYEDIKNNCIIKIPSKPRNCNEYLSNAKDDLCTALASIVDFAYYTQDELKDNLSLIKDNVEVIIDILKQFDSRLKEFKNSHNAYTFTDISLMAIDIVSNNKDVSDELKHYFNEIMVDEYQDTSDLQEIFISHISSNNVYMVGDIKQSIYRFRNANPDIFRTKYNDYLNNNGGFKIDLLKNFRSRDEVLNNINEIFDSVMDEKFGNAKYQESHRMIFGNHMYDLKDNQNYDLDILNYTKDDNYKDYSNEEIEAFIIARDIKNKVDNHYQILDKIKDDNGAEKTILRDFNYGDACIIMDRGSAFDTYKKIFEYLSIPLVVWQDEELNESTDIAVLKNIICMIIRIKNSYNLEKDLKFKYYFTSVARSYLFEYSDDDILDIFLNNKFIDNEIYLKALSISNDLDNLSNTRLLDRIIKEFNLYENAIKVGNIEKYIVRIDNLNNLFSSLENLGYTPYDLEKYFEDTKDNEQKYSLNTKVPGNVNLMNIHKSKGLEFSVCYFSGFYKKFNDTDLKDRFIFNNKYGIILPFYKDGLDDTILKELYKNSYRMDDISERIRLMYVGVTRAKEKMIIVAPLTEDDVKLNNIVSDKDRRNYKSFLDIINSVKPKLNKYINNIDLASINLSKDYDLVKTYNYKDMIDDSTETITHIENNINSSIMNESHFSKVSHKLNTKEEIKNMELGTYIHYLFEITDFNNPIIDSEYKDLILNLINKLDLNCNIYKEYEFMYEEDNTIKHGIIDLMLEYTNHIDIIDYKLKHTVDENYKKQVTGYKNYIYSITGKKVNTYLYSILDNELKEII